MTDVLRVGGRDIRPGERVTLELPLARLYTDTPLTIPVRVLRGRKPGPCLFVSAALHGDEILGVEIIRRLLRHSALKRLRGTLIAVPIVNVFGFVGRSRYLPDRRDLNRSFPGSERGSLAARMAHIFLKEVVAHCSVGIDLHTAAVHRANFPQVRANLVDAETARLARGFGAPLVVNAELREGSLREVAHERGLPVLVYEAGEALRFDELSIRIGVRGILAVMRELGMLPASRRRVPTEPIEILSTVWVRAPEGGVLRAHHPLGARVAKGERLGTLADPLGQQEIEVAAPCRGVLLGMNRLPLVNEGEALFHLGRVKSLEEADEQLEELSSELGVSADAPAAAPEPGEEPRW